VEAATGPKLRGRGAASHGGRRFLGPSYLNAVLSACVVCGGGGGAGKRSGQHKDPLIVTPARRNAGPGASMRDLRRGNARRPVQRRRFAGPPGTVSGPAKAAIPRPGVSRKRRFWEHLSVQARGLCAPGDVTWGRYSHPGQFPSDHRGGPPWLGPARRAGGDNRSTEGRRPKGRTLDFLNASTGPELGGDVCSPHFGARRPYPAPGRVPRAGQVREKATGPALVHQHGDRCCGGMDGKYLAHSGAWQAPAGARRHAACWVGRAGGSWSMGP